MVVQAITIEGAMTRLKKHVYKQRVRVKDFIIDFDKLNSGFVHPNHFLTALNMAGVHKHLEPAELELICKQYEVQRDATLTMVDYRTFLHELELVFTVPVRSGRSRDGRSGMVGWVGLMRVCRPMLVQWWASGGGGGSSGPA